MSRFNATVRHTFNCLGFDISRRKDVPALTLLGLPSRPIRTIIDVGANRGQFAHKFLTLFPQAILHCFEPLPEPCAQLRVWAQTHKNVQVYQKALGDASGTATFLHHIDHSPSSSLLSATQEAQDLFPQTTRQRALEVEVSTLDEFFPANAQAPAPEILLKLDVQGYEDRVLRGGRMFLNRVDVVITELSVASLYENQARFIDICQELNSAGLSYAGNLDQVYGSDGAVLFLDAVFTRTKTPGSASGGESDSVIGSNR